MLVKSLVAGTVLTLLAGGAVYYGTDVDGNISAKAGIEKLESFAGDKTSRADKASNKDKNKDMKASASEEAETSSEASVDHPHAGHGDEAAKRSSDIPAIDSKLIDPKSGSMSGTIKEASIDDDVEVEFETDVVSGTEESSPEPSEAPVDKEADTSSETPTRKWIDQYLKSESESEEYMPEDNQAEAEAAAEITAREASEAEAEAAMEAEIAAVLAQEEALEKELTAMMAEMGETETLEEIELTDEAPEVEETEIELFTEEEILEAEAKGFEDRAKAMENIWVSKGEELSDTDTKTLHDVLKDHKSVFIGNGAEGSENIEVKVIKDETGTTTTETETIDLGDGKTIKVVKVKRVEGDVDDRTEKKIHVKVLTDEGLVDHMDDLAESELEHEVINTEDGKTIKIRKMKMPHAHKHGEKSYTDSHDKNHAAAKSDVSETAKIIMAQAEKINMSELRDRAYLDLVSYALENGNKAVANKAMSKIEQVELRDTARNRMAVSYAKNGNAEKAFAILEEIEVEALRDVMRLQVIEALIVPETPAPAPQDMQ